MTELLNGQPTPRTQCFNALPQASPPPLLLFSISSRALINEAEGFGGAFKLRRLRETKAQWKVTIKKLSMHSEVSRP